MLSGVSRGTRGLDFWVVETPGSSEPVRYVMGWEKGFSTCQKLVREERDRIMLGYSPSARSKALTPAPIRHRLLGSVVSIPPTRVESEVAGVRGFGFLGFLNQGPTTCPGGETVPCCAQVNRFVASLPACPAVAVSRPWCPRTQTRAMSRVPDTARPTGLSFPALRSAAVGCCVLPFLWLFC